MAGRKSSKRSKSRIEKFSDFNVSSTIKGGSSAGKKARAGSLGGIRDSLRPLLDKAREAISKLKEEGVLEKSEAYQTAMRTASRSSDEVFSLDDKHRFRELKREASRLTAFLADPEVSAKITSYNDKIRDAVRHHAISFQNQKEAFAATGNRFDVEDQDRMKLALRIFRDIASSEPAVIGKNAYGSDNLINLIYDELEGYDPDMPEQASDFIITKAHDVAFASVQEYKFNTVMGFLEGSPTDARNSDVNIVEEIRKSQSAEEFYESVPFLKGDW